MAKIQEMNKTQKLAMMIQKILHFLSPLVAPLAQHITDGDTEKALKIVDRLREVNQELRQHLSGLGVGSITAVLIDGVVQFLGQLLTPLTDYIDQGETKEASEIVEKLRLMLGGLRQYCRASGPIFAPIAVNLKAIIESVVYCFSEGRGIKIEADPNFSYSIIQAGEEELSSAIGNILENIIMAIGIEQFSSSRAVGQPFLNISFKRIDGRVQITCFYSGPAISLENLNPCFPPIVKDEASRLLLDLLSAKMIIEHHGGEILVRSEKDEETCFIIILPIDQKPEKDKKSQ